MTRSMRASERGVLFVALWLGAVVCGGRECVAGGAGQASAAPVSSSPFGVVCPWRGVSKIGVRWCRVGAGATGFANWPRIETEPGKFDWSPCDNELRAYYDPEGLSLLPILGYTPKWASRRPEAATAHAYPPRDLETYARFVFEIVSRYKRRVKVWEVWNEPNIGFFQGSAADYAELVKAASVAAKRADPTCRLAMGCAGVDVDFLRRLYEFGCGPFFDVMSVHPYQWNARFNEEWFVEKLRTCRALMDEFGDSGKEIWLTELGWSTGAGITEAQQADLLVQALTTALTVRNRLRVEKVFWFCIKDWGGPGYGLLDTKARPKPAFTAYRALTSALAHARYVGALRGVKPARGRLFDRRGKPVLVLWNPAPEGAVPVKLTTRTTTLRVRTTANELQPVTVVNGQAQLAVTHAPVFVTGFAPGELDATPDGSAAPPGPPSPPETPQPVWLSIVPPASTMRPYLVLNAPNTFPLRVHNGGDRPAQGRLSLELRLDGRRLAAATLDFNAAPGRVTTVAWRTTPPLIPEGAGKLGVLRLRGVVGATPLDPVDLPVRLVRDRAIEFLGNSFTERQYLQPGADSGCADSVRFGREWVYRFELPGARRAKLRVLIGANQAHEWNVSVSADGKSWKTALSGASWPAWHECDVHDYLPPADEGADATLFVKVHGRDCQLRELILTTGPA